MFLNILKIQNQICWSIIRNGQIDFNILSDSDHLSNTSTLSLKPSLWLWYDDIKKWKPELNMAQLQIYIILNYPAVLDYF